MALTLLGEWGFLDNLLDTSGNGRHGTFTAGSGGSLTYGAGPQVGTKAITFSHANDSINWGRTGLEPALDGVTVMGWVKMTTTGAVGFLGILTHARASGSSRSRISITRAARNPGYVARWKDDLHTSDAPAAVDANWHHIAIADGNTGWVFYVDGVAVAGHSGSRALDNTSTPPWEAFNWRSGFNADYVDTFAHPNMSLSGLRIFQGQATAGEITTWMNTPIRAMPSPVSHFDWHEGSGPITSSIVAGGYVLTAVDGGGTAWRAGGGARDLFSGKVGPTATQTNWTATYDVVLSSIPSSIRSFDIVAFDGSTTYDRYFGLKFFLEDLLGCPIDLVTETALRPELRNAVLGEAILVA